MAKTSDLLTFTFGNTTRAQARKLAGKRGGKVVAKHASKSAGKAIARTAASPWLLTADGVEIATETLARSLGCEEKTVVVARRGAGLATSIGVGAAVAGPVGVVAGAMLWGVGELIGKLFD